MSQKIIIPKGLINPNETTIIEIPEDIQSYGTFIAKPKYDDTLGYCVADFPLDHNTPHGESRSNLQCLIEDGYDENVAESSKYCTAKYVNTDDLYFTYPEQHSNTPYYEYGDTNSNSKKTQIESDDIELEKSPVEENNGKMSGVGFPTECLRNLEEDILQMQQNISLIQKSRLSNKTQKGPYTIPSHAPNDLMSMLDVMDQIEVMKIQKSLTEFQSARRKLVHATTNLPTVHELSLTLGYLKKNKSD